MISGLKSVTTPLSPAAPLKAARVAFVVATTRTSGPAAAMRPFLEATVRREADEGGRLSLGHGDGRSRTLLVVPLLLDPRVENPRDCIRNEHVSRMEFCLGFAIRSLPLD